METYGRTLMKAWRVVR